MFFLKATIFLATQFFQIFIVTFCIGYTRTEKKYVKVIDDDICNRKIEFKTKSELIKRNKNYKKDDKKIWRIFSCKEIVALRYFLYKVWFVQFDFWNFVFADSQNFGNYFLDQLEPTFLANVYAYYGKPLFRLAKTSFFYLLVHPW